MKINIHELRERPLDLELNLSAGDLLLEAQDVEFTEPVKVSLHLRMIAEEIFVSGRLTTRARAGCVRCLKPVDIPIEIKDLKLAFLPRPARSDSKEVMIDPDEEDVGYYDKDEVNLDHDIRELILLELPGYPTCVKECRVEQPSSGEEAESSEPEEVPEWKNVLKNIKIDPNSR